MELAQSLRQRSSVSTVSKFLFGHIESAKRWKPIRHCMAGHWGCFPGSIYFSCVNNDVFQVRSGTSGAKVVNFVAIIGKSSSNGASRAGAIDTVEHHFAEMHKDGYEVKEVTKTSLDD